MAKQETKTAKVVERKGYEKVGGFEAEFFSFKKAGDEFTGKYLKMEVAKKKSKFSKKPVEVNRYFFESDGKKWQIDNMGNLGYLIDQANLTEGKEVLIVYNGKKDGGDKKKYHNFDLFIKK
ncbi:MAG: hypothetical protein IJ890_05695 [Clostridia bacterium]|nr:hypothetical protein [Clostridia bacterium]